MSDEILMRNWSRGMPVVRGRNPKYLTFMADVVYAKSSISASNDRGTK
jgi:hypothetical protein